LATGERRAAYLPVSPPDDVSPLWSVDPASGLQRGAAPTATADGDGAKVSGQLAFVPDAPARTCWSAWRCGTDPGGVGGQARRRGDRGRRRRRQRRDDQRYDASRSLGHVTLDNAPATLLDAPEQSLASAWYLAQSLVAAESLGASKRRSTCPSNTPKERHTFARDRLLQAVKHRADRGAAPARQRALAAYYAGLGTRRRARRVPARRQRPRSVAGRALDQASRTNDLRARWHRRGRGSTTRRCTSAARSSRGGCSAGTNGATDRVAGELMAQADAA